MATPIEQPRVHGYDRTIVIVRGMALPPELTPARLPREPDRHTVIVAADPPIELPTLVELLSHHLPVRCESIRLVLSDAGQPGVAQVVADRLEIEVLAPTGAVMLLRTGMLFVAGGTWWCFRPGQPAQREGARHPAPDWQRLLPSTLRGTPPGLGVTAIPAGLWVHDADQPELTAATLSVHVDQERPTVVIGRPGAPVLAPEPVYDLLESLPRQLRRQLILVPYGADSATADTVGEWLALRTGGTVEVMSGVADTDSDGAGVRTTVDATGVRGWRPFAQRLAYRAAAAPQVVEWRRPLPDVAGVAGVQRVDDTWAIEVVRCGLWLRPTGEDPEQDLVRRLPVDANHPLLVLGAPIVAAPTEALAALDKVVSALPASVTGTLRLAVTRPPDSDRSAWAALVERFGPLLSVVGPGHLVELPTPPSVPTTDPAGAGPTVPAPVPVVPEPVSAVPAPVPVVPEPEPEPEPSASDPAPAPAPASAVALASGLAVAPDPAPALASASAPALASDLASGPGRWPTPRSAPLTRWGDGTGPSLPERRPGDVRERQVLRDLLGARYQRYADTVARSAHGRTGGPDGDGVPDDLVSVVAFVADDEIFHDAASTAPEVLTCLAGGLAGLPVAPGPVFGHWAVDPDSGWDEGDVLAATGVLAARVSPDRWEPGAPVFAVWSTAGRQTAGLPPAGREHVLFPAGARFRVLGVDRSHGDEPVLVLLRETEPARESTDREVTASDRRAREGLHRAVEAVRRSEAGPGWPTSLVPD
ncbi:hypothetical protein ACI2K4_02040 [Micromonospora sp. NPDC050397]|uniref:hypothetical protein n=1 Tax=Micromonospora sp. NPDC050397 TaxID=3364279 RepID=UPI00384B90C6